jgi:hypothetical protein
MIEHCGILLFLSVHIPGSKSHTQAQTIPSIEIVQFFLLAGGTVGQPGMAVMHGTLLSQ